MRMLYITLVVLFGATLTASVAHAQDGSGGTKTAVVNLSKAFDGYEMTKALSEKFNRKEQEGAEEAKSRREAIDVKEQALASFKPGSADYKKRSAKLREMRVEFQVWATIKQQELRDWHKEWMLKIYKDLQSAAGRVASERGIDLVLIREDVSEEAADSNELVQRLLVQKVLYYDGKLDITDAVVAVANEAFLKRGGPDSIKFGTAKLDDRTMGQPETRLTDARK